MKYFLDTNIIIYAVKGKFPAIPEHFARVPAASIVVPAMVLAEIEYGARKSRDYNKTIGRYLPFLEPFEVVPFSDAAARSYGEIRSRLEKGGKTIGANNLVIAATVLSEGGILITHNTKEFARIPGLNLEDWTKPLDN